MVYLDFFAFVFSMYFVLADSLGCKFGASRTTDGSTYSDEACLDDGMRWMIRWKVIIASTALVLDANESSVLPLLMSLLNIALLNRQVKLHCA